MRSNLVKFWEDLRSSYWFFPALMALGAVTLSFVLTTLDTRIGAAWLLDRVDWLDANQPDGARALLSTIAGSMITVAGVTFSITIAAVAFASSQFGPRILTNFMEDRGNQITLGTFIATFLYCLLVLRTVRSPGEAIAGEQSLEGFVPHLAIVGALVLALISVGVLIYFIHHVPESIHVSNVIARIGRELESQVTTLFPERLGDDKDAGDEAMKELPDGFYEAAVAVPAREAGYIHNIDSEGLFHLTREHDLTVQVISRPGRFAVTGQTFLLAWPPGHMDNAVKAALEGTFAQGSRRTAVQDLLFLVDELVEIAARALSPGVNDPFTAMACMNWLRAGLVAFAERQAPGACRYDDEDTLRVVAYPITFDDYAAAFFDRMLPYASADANAARYLMQTMSLLMVQLENDRHRAVIEQRADALMAACREALPLPASIEAVVPYHQAVQRLAQPHADSRSNAEAYAWLNGQV